MDTRSASLSTNFRRLETVLNLHPIPPFRSRRFADGSFGIPSGFTSGFVQRLLSLLFLCFFLFPELFPAFFHLFPVCCGHRGRGKGWGWSGNRRRRALGDFHSLLYVVPANIVYFGEKIASTANVGILAGLGYKIKMVIKETVLVISHYCQPGLQSVRIISIESTVQTKRLKAGLESYDLNRDIPVSGIDFLRSNPTASHSAGTA
jgi:hypothetical protein